MSLCSHCQIELYADAITGTRNLRCANCNGLNTLSGESTSKNQNRIAMYSFWMGLIPWLCALVTFVLAIVGRRFMPSSVGIPIAIALMVVAVVSALLAIFLGIRALAKMRYQPTSQLAALAAFAGVAKGTFFTLLSAVILTCVGIGLYFYNSVESSENPLVAYNLTSPLMNLDKIQFGEELKIRSATRVKQVFHTTDWTDDHLDWHWLDGVGPRAVYKWNSKNRSTRLRISMVPAWLASNHMQVNNLVNPLTLSELRGKQTGKESFKWRFLSEEKPVTKLTIEVDDNGTTATHEKYFCYEQIGSKTYIFAIIHDSEKSGLTMEDIRKIAESFELAETEEHN